MIRRNKINLLIFILNIILCCNFYILIKNEDLTNYSCANKSYLLSMRKASIENLINQVYYNVDTIQSDFDFEHDMIALVLIQGTNGNQFELHIWLNLYIRPDNEWRQACVPYIFNNRYICEINKTSNERIYWDRYSYKFCNVHADYTELYNYISIISYQFQLKKKKNSAIELQQGLVYFITQLKNPVDRYIDEYEELKSGLNAN